MASIRSTKVGQHIELKKIAQIYCNKYMNYLTSHTDSAYSSYPKVTDPSKILTVGMKFKVISIGKPQTRYTESYVTVIDNRNNKFDIFASDLRKHFN